MTNLPFRIVKELKLLNEDGSYSYEFNDNEFIFNLEGPKKSLYEGYIYILRIFIHENYPINPPYVYFETKIFHPNIDSLGKICMDILDQNWKPSTTIQGIIQSIQVLLKEPNPNDPLNNQAAELYENDYDEYVNVVQEYNEQYAEENELDDSIE